MTFIKADCVINGEDTITHAHSINGNSVIIIPPHEFKQTSCWYYKVQEVTNYDFRVVTYGITSTPYFIKILKAITKL
jgi:hypothetical protein